MLVGYPDTDSLILSESRPVGQFLLCYGYEEKNTLLKESVFPLDFVLVSDFLTL